MNTTYDLHKLLKVPPVEFEKLFDDEHPTQAEIDELEGCAIHLLRLAEYLNSRAYMAGHKDAVKSSNKVVRAARKALGYNITHDINF